MPDLFNLIPGIGQLKGLLGPSVAETDSSLMPAPDPTTILGVPLQALGTAGIGWGLGRLLTNKRNRQIGQLRGLQLGLGLGMAPIQQEQAQYDKTMQAALDKGLLTPYQTPSPQPVSPEGGWQEAAPDAVASQAGLAAAPTTMTPAAPPSVNYGGMRLMATPRVNLGALYPGLPQGVANYQVIPTASDAYNAGQAAIAQAGEARALEEDARLKEERQKLIGLATSRGITDAEKMPIRMLYERLARQQGLQDLTSMQGALAGSITPTSRVTIGVDANGNPTYQLQQVSEAELEDRAAERAFREEQLGATREDRAARRASEEAQARYQAEAQAGSLQRERLQSIQEMLRTSAVKTSELRQGVKDLEDQFGIPQKGKEAAHTLAQQRYWTALEDQQKQIDTAVQQSRNLLGIQEPAAPPETPVDPKLDAQAQRIAPDLGYMLSSTTVLPLRPPAPGPAQDTYDIAASKYYELTDEPLADITARLRNQFTFGGSIRPQPPPELMTYLYQRYGEQRANAAVQRWLNRR